MDSSHYERIKTDRRGRILTLTLTRPETLNSVDLRMHDELAGCVRTEKIGALPHQKSFQIFDDSGCFLMGKFSVMAWYFPLLARRIE